MLHFVDGAVILISLLVVVGAVLRAVGKRRSGTEYFLAGRDLAWPFVGMSLFASNISAEHVIGMAGDGYRIGLVAGGYEWVGAWDLIILAALFAPLYLRGKIFTIPEFLERRFGWSLRALLSANLLLINVLTKNAIDLWAGSLLFTVLFGWKQTWVMIAMSAFTALYTMKGGLRAVVYADMVQGTWLILSSALLTAVGLIRVGGWHALLAQIPAGRMDMVKPLNSELPITGFLIANVMAGMFYWCMDQTNVQRVLGARTIADGQRGAIFAGFLKLLVPFILVLPGTIGGVLYPDLPTYDSAYPRLVEGLLPVGLRGLVLAGLVAILMSSMSACYNSSATLVVRDFVLRFRPATSEQQQVVTGRWVTVAVAILGVLAAPLVGLSVTIWYYLQDISAYLSVPMAAAIFLGFLWKRGTTAGAVTAVVVGFGAGLVCFLDQTLHWSLRILAHPYLHSFLHRSLLVWIITALVMVGVSLATSPPDSEKVRDNVFRRWREPWLGLRDYRAWAALLFFVTVVLWWSFR
ncbi:MAG: sodium transporter [Acidobacteria bacterium]|nr:MAG: sodium transporter [Acidobacteriota bacterium]